MLNLAPLPPRAFSAVRLILADEADTISFHKAVVFRVFSSPEVLKVGVSKI